MVDILALKRILIMNEYGDKIVASSLWKSQPVVLVFLRHFGCIACRAQVAQIMKNKASLEKNGAKIIFVGNGSPNMIESFKEELKIKDLLVFTDPSLEIFDACGFNRGLKYLVNAKTVLQGIKLYNEGFSQGVQTKENGSHLQMGGIIALKPPGIVTYHFASEYLGHFGDVEEIEE
jgi:peroxiredoxin